MTDSFHSFPVTATCPRILCSSRVTATGGTTPSGKWGCPGEGGARGLQTDRQGSDSSWAFYNGVTFKYIGNFFLTTACPSDRKTNKQTKQKTKKQPLPQTANHILSLEWWHRLQRIVGVRQMHTASCALNKWSLVFLMLSPLLWLKDIPQTPSWKSISFTRWEEGLCGNFWGLSQNVWFTLLELVSPAGARSQPPIHDVIYRKEYHLLIK